MAVSLRSLGALVGFCFLFVFIRERLISSSEIYRYILSLPAADIVEANFWLL